MKSCGQASGFVQLLLMFYFWAPESYVMADEMVMIAEPFLQVCLIINSIMDSLFAWSPIRKSQPTRAQQTSGLIDTLVHVGTWKEAWSECMTDQHKCQPSLTGLRISRRNGAKVWISIPTGRMQN